MNTIKEKLGSALGGIGLILWYAVSAIVTFAPLFCVLKFNFFIDFLIILAILAFPLVGAVVELVIWVWSFVVAISMPFDIFMGIYYVALAIYVLTKLVPMVLTLFSKTEEY